MRRGTRILCGIFGFYLSLALLAPQIAAALYVHYFNPAVLCRELCSDAAAEQAMERIVYDGEAIADGCGLPYSVFDGVFSAQKVRQDMTDALQEALNGGSFRPDLAGERERLETNVRDSLAELDGVTDFSPYEADIAAFCDQVETLYGQYVDLSIYGKFDSIYSTAMRILKPAAVAVAAVGLVCLLFLLALTWRIGQFGRELSFSLIASGGLFAILSGAVLASGALARIQVDPPYFRDALNAYLQDGLWICLLIGVGVALIGCCIFAFSAWLARRRTA